MFIHYLERQTYRFSAVFQLTHQVSYVQRDAYYYVPSKRYVREQGTGSVPGDVVQQRPFPGRLLEKIKQSGGLRVGPSFVKQTAHAQNLRKV